MKIFKILLFSALFSVMSFNFAAAMAPAVFNESLNKTAEGTGHKSIKLSQEAPSIIIAKVVSVILSLVGVIFLILIIYAGFLWMTARGNEQQIEKAKNIIINSIIGIFVVLSAYAISYLVVSSIGN